MSDFRNYPIAAVVGQNKLKTAYLANIVNPQIGGLLISGPKGTGKSTIVHSIENILPKYRSVRGCLFNCNPDKKRNLCSLCKEKENLIATENQKKIVNLPLSCSEDSLIGSINIEKLLKEKKKEVQAGILGKANRNLLYVDEVNLLPDHLVDDILDAAASHWNTIEREGISISHPTEFILIGSMNPEEGELRPQILDRFPLCVKLKTISDKRERVEIVKRNIMFERNPVEFYKYFEEESNSLKEIIKTSKEILNKVSITESYLFAISTSCIDLKVDGQRPDIIINKTAKTISALDGRQNVIEEDILMAADLTLNHRTRDGGLLEPPTVEEILSVFSKNIKSIKEKNLNKNKSFSFEINEINKKDFSFTTKIKKEGFSEKK